MWASGCCSSDTSVASPSVEASTNFVDSLPNAEFIAFLWRTGDVNSCEKYGEAYRGQSRLICASLPGPQGGLRLYKFRWQVLQCRIAYFAANLRLAFGLKSNARHRFSVVEIVFVWCFESPTLGDLALTYGGAFSIPVLLILTNFCFANNSVERC